MIPECCPSSTKCRTVSCRTSRRAGSKPAFCAEIAGSCARAEQSNKAATPKEKTFMSSYLSEPKVRVAKKKLVFTSVLTRPSIYRTLLQVEFEFDPAKSKANQEKHGISFEKARELWAGNTLSVSLPFAGEPRRLVVGTIAGKHWTAIVTERSGATRIISVRRSRSKEIETYEQSS
jgi:uncharacterized DUF497 family protein